MPHRGIGAVGAWFVFAGIVFVGLLLTTGAYQFLSEAERERQEAILTSAAEQGIGVILGQFARFETQLTAAQALFDGSRQISREEWRAFTRNFQRDGGQRSFFEMAWLPEVPADQLPRLLDMLAEDGIDEFGMDPPGSRSVYCPIIYNEPWEIHADSLGHDACARESTFPAMAQARSTGLARLSSPLNLVAADGQSVPGYVMFAWTEGSDHPFSGWVGGTIAIDAVFDLSLAGESNLELLVTDHSSADSPRRVFGDPETPDRLRSVAVLERTIELGGRHLQLQFRQPIAASPAPTLLLATGSIITVLLASFVLVLLRNRARALALAERMSRAWRESEEMLSSITDNVIDGIYRGVPGQGLVYVNQSVVSMFGFRSARAMIDDAGPILYANPKQRDELHRQLVDQGQYTNQEVEFVRQDGSRFTAINNCVAIRDTSGQILHFDGVISDITERKRAEQEVHRLAHYDPLTGLPNRALLNDRIDQALRRAQRKGQPLALMFMDLDRFKTINDSLGHGVGDELLSAVAERLTAEIRDYDTISRLGGDEFVIVLPEADANSAALKASAILKAFKRAFRVSGHELTVTPSIGIAMYPDDADDTETLVRNADAAMYHAKERGRSTFRFFTAELNARAYERLTMENHLRGALDNGELSLVYQPLFSVADQRITGAEALLRWHNPVLGEVPPDQFIPVAEQSGLIVDIGDWVIDTACRQLAAWHQAGFGHLSVAINVSAVQFWRGSLNETVRRALERWQLEPRRVEVELTESVIMHDSQSAREVLADLKRLGVGLVIDDFGTGYSSLSYLKQFQIDLLKIDRSFVRDVATDPEDAAIVSAILSMARDLKIRVVAEGVEDQQQLEFLRTRGCHFAQGFLLDRPLSPERFMVRVRREAAG